jgi:hypothetical protein
MKTMIGDQVPKLTQILLPGQFKAAKILRWSSLSYIFIEPPPQASEEK